MRVFWKNTAKFASSVTLPPDPHVVTLTYYYNFIEFVSSVKCVSLTSQKDKMTFVHVLPLLFPHFCTYFSLQTHDGRGGKNISLPQGAGYPSYTTTLRVVIQLYAGECTPSADRA